MVVRLGEGSLSIKRVGGYLDNMGDEVADEVQRESNWLNTLRQESMDKPKDQTS